MGQFTIYRSSDAGAPVLTGASGSLLALLDACLVNGYGAKPAAGWSKAFSGVNKAAYRMGGGARMYLWLDDAPGTYANARGYQSMSDVDTGTGQFPTTAQAAFSCLIKSNTADTTARTWLLFADHRTLYLFVLTGNTTSTIVHTPFAFGEFDSFVPADPYNVMIAPAFSAATSNTSFNAAMLGNCGYHYGGSWSSSADLFAAGSVAGVPSSAAVQFCLASGLGQCYSTDARKPAYGHIAYPNGAEGGLYVSRKLLIEYAGVNSGAYNCTFHVRGLLRGLWVPLHFWSTFNHGDVFSGAGPESARSFEIIRPIHCTGANPTYNGTYTLGVLALESSATLS